MATLSWQIAEEFVRNHRLQGFVTLLSLAAMIAPSTGVRR
jgi:hypothetical protein